MEYQASEQKKIMEMVKAGACGEVLSGLDKQTVRRYAPSFVSKMLLELIPREEKEAKELAELLVDQGRMSWNERDADGRMIHAVMIRYGRVWLASRAVRNLRRKDAHDPGLSPVWSGLLWWLLDKQQRTAAMTMLQRGVMRFMDENEQERVLRKILSCHDISLLEPVRKYIHCIPGELLSVPQTLSERNFMRELLDQYAGYIETGDGTQKIWELALECGAANMAGCLLKKTGGDQYLPRLAAGSDEMFGLLLRVPCRRIPDEVKKEVLFGALGSSSWKMRFRSLVRKGWKKSSRDRKKEIMLAGEYDERIKTKRYASGRDGNLERVNDGTKVRFVRRYEQT